MAAGVQVLMPWVQKMQMSKAVIRWRQEFMTEAVQEVIQWAFRQETIFRVWVVCDEDNKASARVLEKTGMKCEGILRR